MLCQRPHKYICHYLGPQRGFGTLLLLLLAGFAVGGEPTEDSPTCILVRGASGSNEYGQVFDRCVERWRDISQKAGIKLHVIGTERNSVTDRETLRTTILQVLSEDRSRLWLVFIGHGTWQDGVAKFNLRGPDVSAEDLNDWLKDIQQPLVFVNCSSASAPFLKQLSAPGRIIITATKSGAEINFSRFGDFFSKAIAELQADLDHDRQVSLLEAFLSASKQTKQFYDEAGRLATEHAILDDNGDGLGTTADFFVGVRAVKSAQSAPLDGPQARRVFLFKNEFEQRLSDEAIVHRDRLESQIELLRSQKSELNEADYYAQLEKIFLELASIYEKAQPVEEPRAAR